MANGQDMKETLDRIEEEIQKVKRLYDLYFQGARRTEPSDKRREVEETIRRIGQRKIVNTNEQFRFNSLQTRFYSLSNLWSRMTRDLEEGRLTRDTTGTVTHGTPRAPDPVDPARLDRVIGELAEARKACGLPAGEEDLSATREALLSRAREIAEKAGGRQVEFQVRIEEGKPKIKAVVR